MRKTKKGCAMVAIALVLGLVLAGCPTDGGDGGGGDGGGPTNFGETLTLSGQVYTRVESQTSITYTPYNGDALTVTANGANVGSISRGGGLSATINAPTGTDLQPIVDLSRRIIGDEDSYTNIKISDNTANGYALSLKVNNGSLYRENESFSVSAAGGSATYEQVDYFYVDKDVTITAKGGTETDTFESATATVTFSDLNLSLKKGWNTRYIKRVESANYSSNNYTATMSMSIANPNNLKWLYDEGH